MCSSITDNLDIWTTGRSWGYFYYEPVPHNDAPPQKNKQLFTGLRTDRFIFLKQPKIKQDESLHLSQLQEKPVIVYTFTFFFWGGEWDAKESTSVCKRTWMLLLL